jgi:transcriptional regulator with XRE-family HTH domain
MVDAEPVRRHIAVLRAAGMSVAKVAEEAGVGYSVVRHILYGTHNMPPARQTFRSNAEAILRLRPDVESMPACARVEGAGTRRRIQALMTLGWTSQDIADRVGYTRVYVTALSSRGRVTAAAAKRIGRVFKELSMTVPADTLISRRTKAFARRKGWLPPLAWDEEWIDLTDEALTATVRELAEQMDDDELKRCAVSRRGGDRSPLTVAACREYDRRRYQRKVAA